MTNRTATYKLQLQHDQFTGALKLAQSEVDNLAKGLSSKLGPAGAALEKLGPLGLAAAAGLGAVVAAAGGLAKAAKDAADFGGRINDLSLKTGISTTALQRLEHAGRLSGASLESLTGAVNKMQKELVNAPKNFDALGLSASKLKSMEPDKALAAVAASLQKIQNPAQQAAAAMAVFGKSGAELLPVLKSNLAEAGDEAERLGMVLGQDTIKALDDFGDATDTLSATWGGLWKQLGAAVATTPAVQKGIKDLTEAAGNFAKTLIENKAAIQGFVSLLTQLVGLAAKPIIFTVKVVGGAASGLGLDKSAGLYSTLFGAAGDWLSSAFSGPETLAQQKSKHDLMMRQLAAGAGADRALAADGGGGGTFDPAAMAAARKRFDTLVAVALASPSGGFGAEFSAFASRSFATLGTVNIGAGLGGNPFARNNGIFGGEMGPGDIFGRRDISGMLAGTKMSIAGGSFLSRATASWDQQLERLAHTMAALGPLTAGFVGKLGGMMGAIASIGANIGGFKKAGGGFSGFLGQLGAVGGIAAAGLGIFQGLRGLFGGPSEEEKRAKAEAHKQKGDDLLSQFDALSKQIETMLRDLAEKGARGFGAVLANVAAQTDVTAERLQRMGRFALVTFDTMRKAGFSAIDSIKAMQRDLDILMKLMESKGQKPGAGFQALFDFSLWAEAKAGAIDAASGIAEMIAAMSRFGMLTKETFADLSAETFDLFLQLGGDIENLMGAASQRALSFIAQALFNLRKEAERLGLVLDADTLKLIEAAEKGGLFEDLKDPFEELNESVGVMVGLLALMVQHFGVKLPDAIQKYIDKLNEIPNLPGGGGTGGTGGGGNADPDGGLGDGVPKPMASGGYVRPRPGGSLRLLAEAGEGEWVVPDSKVGAFANRFGDNSDILRELREMNRLLRAQPETWRDAGLLGRA